MPRQPTVGIIANIKAGLILRNRRYFDDGAFIEIVVWQVPAAVPGSAHVYKYRMAYVENDVCVLRYDNEREKGDHRPFKGVEEAYTFTTVDALLDAFFADVATIRRE